VPTSNEVTVIEIGDAVERHPFSSANHLPAGGVGGSESDALCRTIVRALGTALHRVYGALARWSTKLRNESRAQVVSRAVCALHC
jgi:hypothetical protein